MFRLLNAGSLIALGWSLLNSIWQMGILWLAFLALTRNHKRFSAAVRHNLALLLSGLGLVWFIFSLIMGLLHPQGFIHWAPRIFFSSTGSSILFTLLYALTIVYLIILVLRCARYILEFFQLEVRKRRSGTRFSEALQCFANKVSPVMGIGKKINVMLADWVDTAQTVGFLKPLVLFPIALLNQLSADQVETILLHELQHIRRHDYLINMMMTLFHTIFFFNPFARLFFKVVAQEREHACDDGVLLWDYAPQVYAEALFALEKFRQFPHSFSMAANGHNPRLLMNRIRRVVGQPASNKNPFSPFLYFSLIAGLSIFTLSSVSRFTAPGEIMHPKERLTEAGTTGYLAVSEKSFITEGQINKIPETAKDKRRFTESTVLVLKLVKHSIKVRHQKTETTIKDHALAMQSDEERANAQLNFADQNEVRNYSFEKAADPTPPVGVNQESAPYVPSASFYYQSATDTVKPYLILQDQLNALAGISKLKTTELQAMLNKEINSKLDRLRAMENENRMIILQKQKNLQPLLLNLKKDILLKKKEINHLRIQLQIQGGEVIVI